MVDVKEIVASRRAFLGLAGGAAAALSISTEKAQAAAVRTSAKIVIIGSGAGGHHC
jgi:uncharacterized protein (DUF1501 family)